jgi:hypothetical protein
MRLRNLDEESQELYWKTSWDFFSEGCGTKSGYVTDLSEAGCTLKTAEPIEYRRWIRMIMREPGTNLSFTAVGRVVRCENAFDASYGSEVTLYSYRVEFTYPVSRAQVREVIRETETASTFVVRPPLSIARL